MTNLPEQTKHDGCLINPTTQSTYNGLNSILLYALLLMLVQFILVGITFPVQELYTRNPLFYIDSAYHWYNMVLAKNLARDGHIIGYDPFFGAGDVSGIFNYLSGRVPALLNVIFSSALDEIIIYKLYAFIVAIFAPLAVFFAAVSLRFNLIESLIAGLLSILLWWISYFHWYYTAGMIGYVASSYLDVLLIALVIRYFEYGGSYWHVFGLGLLGAIGFFWHPLFPIPVAISILIYVILNLGRIDFVKVLSGLTLISIVSILPNLVWIYPTLLYHEKYIVSFNVQSKVNAKSILWELIGVFNNSAHGSKVYPVLFISALWSWHREKSEGNRRLCLSLLVAAFLIQILAYLGALIPAVADIQPNRFSPSGYLILCLPAAYGLKSMFRSFMRNLNHSRIVSGLSIAMILLISPVLTWEVWREITSGDHGRFGSSPPQIRPPDKSLSWVTDWLMTHTNSDARVLFETGMGRPHNQMHGAGYFAYQTKREFIGGPYPLMYFTGFWDGFLFGKPINEIEYDKMSEYFKLYNIGWILVHSEVAKRYFDKMPQVKFDSENGMLKAYVFDQRYTFMVRGEGQIEERGHNNIVVDNIRGDEIILKYHYINGLKSDPPVQIESISLFDDPKKFIRIIKPPERLRLFMD